MSFFSRHFGLLLAAALALLLAVLVLAFALPLGESIMLGFGLLFLWAGIWTGITDRQIRQGRWPDERSPSR